MPLGKHSKNATGRIRKERMDSLAGNLAKDYPEFKKIDPRTKLGTLEKQYGVGTLSQVRKILRGKVSGK